MRCQLCPIRMHNQNKPGNSHVGFFVLSNSSGDGHHIHICHIDIYQGTNECDIDIAKGEVDSPAT